MLLYQITLSMCGVMIISNPCEHHTGLVNIFTRLNYILKFAHAITYSSVYIWQESEYRERAEALVKEVKVLLREMQSGDGDGDIKMLMERLEMVDALQCLGIDRYFDAEIKLILDSAYR